MQSAQVAATGTSFFGSLLRSTAQNAGRHKAAPSHMAPLKAGISQFRNYTAQHARVLANRLAPRPKEAPWFSPVALRALEKHYTLGPAVEYAPGTLRLGSNESAHGPGPKIALARQQLAGIDSAKLLDLAKTDPKALTTVLEQLAKGKTPAEIDSGVKHGFYPDPHATALNEALARVEGLDPADPKVKVVSGPGASQMLMELLHMYVSDGSEVVTTQYSYEPVRIAAETVGGKCKAVPSPGGVVDLAAMKRAITDRTSLIYLDNPGNPTGRAIPPDELRQFIADVKRDHPRVTVVVDAAYNYFADEAMRPDLPALVRDYGAIALKTQSKIHACPEIRLGWALCAPAVQDAWNKYRSIYPLTLEAQVVGKAAVEDIEHVEFCRKDNELARQQLQEGLEAKGIKYIPSQTNFVLVHIDGSPKEPLKRALDDHKIVFRDVKIPNTFRISLPKSGAEVQRVLDFIQSEIDAGHLTPAGSAKSELEFKGPAQTPKRATTWGSSMSGRFTPAWRAGSY